MKQNWIIAAAAFIFSASLIATASSPQAQKPKPAPPAAKPGAAPKVPAPPVKDMTAEEEDKWATETETLVNTACSQCHPIADITRARKTWAEWHDVVVRMAALGIEADEDQLTAVKLYMARYYGVVNVNTAGAPELQAVLGLTSKDAAAVVDYRTAHGDFADADALMKVDGIDKAKITDQPEALRFK